MRIRLGPADLPPGAMRGHELGPERFVLLANVGGAYHAIDDWCNHAGCLLSNGNLEGTRVECPSPRDDVRHPDRRRRELAQALRGPEALPPLGAPFRYPNP